MKKDVFLVDADDTLLDYHGASTIALKNAFAQFGEVWQDKFMPLFCEINDGLWSALERKEITRENLIKTRFSLYLKALDISLDAEKFNRFYLNYLATHPLYFNGAEKFLKALKRLGRVYIVTNGTEWIQKSRFAISGLNDYADGVFISDVIGHNKPSMEYTRYVMQNIPNFSKARAVWIGDSLSADIAAANAAGICSILFDPTERKTKEGVSPDYYAKSYAEILGLLQKNEEKK